MTAKLRIIMKAIEIRLNKGEELEDILASYPNLTPEEIIEIELAYKK